MNARFVDVQALTFDSSLAYAADQIEDRRHRESCSRIAEGRHLANAALHRFGFRSDLPVLFVTGGARGSSPLNERIEAILDELLSQMQVLHQTGAKRDNPDFDRLSGRQAALPDRSARSVSRGRAHSGRDGRRLRHGRSHAGAGRRRDRRRDRVSGQDRDSHSAARRRRERAASQCRSAVRCRRRDRLDQSEASPARLRDVLLELAQKSRAPRPDRRKCRQGWTAGRGVAAGGSTPGTGAIVASER